MRKRERQTKSDTAIWRVRAKVMFLLKVDWKSALKVTNFLSCWKKAKCCISPLAFSQFPVSCGLHFYGGHIVTPRQSDSSARCHRHLCVQLIPQRLRPRPATDFHHRGSRAKGASFWISVLLLRRRGVLLLPAAVSLRSSGFIASTPPFRLCASSR